MLRFWLCSGASWAWEWESFHQRLKCQCEMFCNYVIYLFNPLTHKYSPYFLLEQAYVDALSLRGQSHSTCKSRHKRGGGSNIHFKRDLMQQTDSRCPSQDHLFWWVFTINVKYNNIRFLSFFITQRFPSVTLSIRSASETEFGSPTHLFPLFSFATFCFSNNAVLLQCAPNRCFTRWFVHYEIS